MLSSRQKCSHFVICFPQILKVTQTCSYLCWVAKPGSSCSSPVGWLVGWVPKGKRKILTFWSDDFFAHFRRWVVRTWSELDSKLLAIVLHALASGPCVHYIIALLKAWCANTKIQVASCVRYQRVCFSKWEMHGLFSEHHLRAFDLDVNLGTRAIFVNWWWCIVERTWLLGHDENGCDLGNYKSNSTWLQGTHWIINVFENDQWLLVAKIISPQSEEPI